MFLSTIHHIDQNIILGISSLQTDLLDGIMIFFTKIGDFGFLWIFLTVFFILWKSYRKIGYVFFLGMGLNLLLGEGILKHIFFRARPFETLSDIALKISEPITSSFPSGHSSASWCFAILYSYFFWKISKGSVFFIWFLAIGVTISRLYLQVHYPSDILGGIFVGIVSAFGAICYKNSRK